MLLAHAHVAAGRVWQLAADAGACPDGLGDIKATIARLGVAMFALLLASIGTIALYAGLRYAWSTGKPGDQQEAKSALAAGVKGVGIAALATPLVGLLLWIVGAKACGG
jgi:hypothetical protein